MSVPKATESWFSSSCVDGLPGGEGGAYVNCEARHDQGLATRIFDSGHELRIMLRADGSSGSTLVLRMLIMRMVKCDAKNSGDLLRLPNRKAAHPACSWL